MPILDIEIIDDDPPRGHYPRAAARAIADEVGAVLGSGPSATWVKLRYLPRDSYAESGGDVPHEIRPTFVSVLLAQLPAIDVLRQHAERIAAAVSGALDRPRENVHVLFHPPGVGRIAFGGRLLEK
jgi:phenylpyruvate tautomerase PptA (4-oxalocrotonate tautomerase family)